MAQSPNNVMDYVRDLELVETGFLCVLGCATYHRKKDKTTEGDHKMTRRIDSSNDLQCAWIMHKDKT